MNLKELKIGQSVNVISIGLNMKCNEVITKSVLCRDSEKFYVKNGGINIICSNIDDLHLDTPENRKMLKFEISRMNG